MEQLDITPAPQPTVSSYRVAEVRIAALPAPCIDVVVTDNLGATTHVTYNGDIAAGLLTQLNRGNFSVNSMQKAIINRLVADGKLPAGSVSGTPA